MGSILNNFKEITICHNVGNDILHEHWKNGRPYVKLKSTYNKNIQLETDKIYGIFDESDDRIALRIFDSVYSGKRWYNKKHFNVVGRLSPRRGYHYNSNKYNISDFNYLKEHNEENKDSVVRYY